VTDSHSWGPNTPWQSGPGGQPPGQQPPVYGAYPPGPPVTPPVTVAQYGPQPGPGGRNRKPLIITLSVVAAVVVVAIVVAAIVTFSGSGGSGSAGDAVKGYLDALSRGDAEAALSYSTDQPASKDLLSDEILKRQIARWPITDVKILDDNSPHSFGFAQVHVVAKFGGNTSDVTMSVKKNGKDWKLDHAAIKLDSINAGVGEDALKTVTFFGKTVTGSPAYIFPGWVDIASSNPNLAVKPKKPYLLDALAFTGSTYLNDLDFSLSDSGQSATMSAISAALADCAKSNQLSPPDCPQRAYDPDLVDGTATWGTPDISGIKVTLFDPYHLEVLFSGQTTFVLVAHTRSGGSKSGPVTAFISGKADVRQSPPAVSLR
jgi:hypothetical protein